MNLTGLVKEIEAIACDAGSLLLDERTKLTRSHIEHKGLNDLVTYIDRKSEQLIVNALKPLVPDAGFIVEEQSVLQRKADYQWIIDPLDGTTNYIHGLQPYTISIGLYHRNTALAGVVYDPVSRECFSASKDSGAYLNRERIQVSLSPSVADSLFVTGFPVNEFSRNEAGFQLMDYIIRNTHGIRRLGSAAADLAYVACGRIDAFYEYNLKPWDVAAGALIIAEAGGRISDFSGSSSFVFGKEIVASNNLIFNEFLTILQRFMYEGIK